MKKIFTLCLVLCMSYLSMGATNLKHEFRATWLTTAWGNDWPKTKVTNDATRKQQQDSLIAIFDRLQAGNMNAVCLQVRGRSDAFYQSSYEPWAAELAGARGKDPGYDPLAFAIEEAHKRGLELHAWVNPFRVTSAGTLASTDLVKKNAGQWIIQYNNGSFTGEIIDPGYPEAREYVLNVLMEIISNYDIDGIVMDDYFYPYGGTTTEDAASKALHKPANVVDVNKDGKTDDDWRRSNVDVFLKELYDRIQAKKPWVRFGMGTFGIWTTQTKVAQAYGISLPSGISGLDDYDEQACNPVEWVQNGYVDYINPQLYWPTTSISQNYNKLCQWWAKDVCEHFSNQLTNGKKVHFFSSQSISSNSAVSEIQAEIDANRNNLSSGSTGSVFFDTDAYLNMDNALMTSRFATHALPPAMDWKSNTALAAPTNLTVSGSTLTWQHATAERFTVYVYPKGIAWSTAKNDPAYLQGVIYGNSLDISGIDTNMNDIAVCAYDRFGVEHETAIYGATPGDVTPPASGTITYELNGGVQSSYLTAQDMYADLNVDYNAATGATAAWLSLAECTATNQGIPTAVASMDVTFFTAAGAEKWGWLATYVDKVSADQAVAVASSSSASMRYNLQSFFKNWQHTGWPKSANYTTCGVSTLDAYQPYWKSSFANPTEPTAEVTLYAPYKEGATFDGWYAAADFSGEKVTKIDANTTGTLYAKWVEYIPTIAEVKALADDVVTNVSGVVNHIQGRNLYIQDATGGILVYTSEDPTCKVGDKIVAKGVKAIYGGAPEVKNAVINTTEAGTLAPAQTFEGLSELVADIKYFATRVTVPGLKIVSYDSYNNPTVTDGVNEALCYRMSLDPAQFPIGSKITITAVAGWYNGFQFVGDVAGIELVVIGKKDKYEYPVRNSEEHSYTLINDWVISNNEDNFAANAPGKTDYVRGMAVKDGIMYFINRDTKSIVPVVGATAEMLDPIAITGEHLFERIGENGEWESACKLPFNDIKFDQAGNCLIGSCVSGDGTFQIYLVDLETGAATLVVEERLYDNPDFLNNGYRFDAFGVAGDVTQNGVIMAADATSGSWNVYRWLITDGEVAPAEQITMLLDPEYDQSLFINAAGWGTAPQIFPKDEIGSLFYVDGFNMLPMLFDEGGMLVDDFINCPTQKEVTNKDGDVLMMNTGHNGLVEFQVGDEYFLLMAAGNTAAAVPSCFALFKFADKGRTFDGLEPLWYFPANGMGTLTNGCRTAVPSVEVVDDNTANLYLYTNNNGYARYTLNVGDATSINGVTYELNGGVTNDYGWQSKADMWEAFKIDAGITTLASLDDLKAAGEGSLSTICTPLGASQCQAILDTTKWDWLEAYIMNHQNADAAATKLTEGTSSPGWRYALAAFFLESQRTGWPKSADFSKAGKDEAYIPTWRHAFDNPTNPAEEFVLNAPYKEGYTFAGWYTNADFSGEKVTTINAETEGTLYAKWINSDWIITYTSTDGNIVTPYKTDVFGANIVSNTYENGVGTITFDGPVTSIGNYAFYSCSGLTSITIPNSVTSIGNYAFYSCSGLTSITIPNSVTSIGNLAFSYCSRLTSIVVDGENTTYDSREKCNAIIETATNTLIAGCQNTIIPNSVTSIGEDAFYYCSSLTSITIPNSVTSIGNYAFYYCSSLTSITIPNSVTSIGNLAFSYCSRLTSIVVDGENTTYDSREKCNAIIETATNTLIAGCQNTIIPNSVTSIGNYAFSGCSGLTSITIPNSVKSIGRYAFDSCSGLTSITIPNSVTSIGNCAFSQCTSLTSITIPNSVTSFGYNAFVNCSGLTSIVVDVENTTYDSRENCNAIIETATNTLIAGCQNTIIPDNVTSIGEGAFYGCSSLTSITIPDNVTSIGESAFVYCTSLTSITIPNSVTSIGHFAFGFCINLASVFIPNSITNIESTTFDSCTSLTSITIPNSVTHIGFQAFLNCTSLTTIHVEATTPPALEDSTVFMNTPSPICVIPCGTLAAYQASDWASQVSEFVEDCVEGQQIYYTSTDGNIVTPNINAFDANIVSNIYENGVGTLTFDGPITIVGDSAFHECSTLTSITIPNSVTSIGWSAFFRCSSLTSITIPNSVTSIGWSAFSRCSSLTSITIPNSVTSIGMYAFFGCSSLISITIPNSVTSIGENAFDSCDKLTSMVVESGNIIYDSRENCNAIIKTATSTLIAGCQNTIIPSSVMSIGGAAFSGCSSLISITIPNSVTSIGWSAFYRCSSLTSVTIPNSVTSIGENAFSDCSSLTFITIPNSVTSIGYGAFRDCSSLTSITIPNSVTSIGSQAFADCSSLASVTVGNSVTSIGSQAFWGCSSLTSITIPNSVTSIGDYAFYDCSSLTSITIPNSVTSIGEGAFKYCSSLDTIHVEATTPPTLGEDVFYKTPSPICVIPCGTIAAYEASDWASQVGRFEEDCVEGQQIFYTSTDGNIVIPYATDVFGANIVSNTYENGVGTITFDGPVTSIGGWAFYGCSGLTSITIPNSVTSIGDWAFDGCSSLTSVTIGNSVTSIGDGAFYVCSSLTSITIPNSVTSFGDVAFYGCSGLTSITIPNSVTSIGSGAFSFCPSLTSIVVEGENMTYDSRENCNAIIETATNTLIAGCKNTIIPNSVTSIGYRAFFGCSSLTSITIPNSVTSIGYDAFCVCSKLKTLHVEATTPPALGKDAFNSTPTCHIPCGTLAAYRASNWAQYVGKFSGNCPPLVVKAKVPAFWENDVITVWVWTDGDGTEYPTTKDGDWYVYTHTDYTDFNIIFKSGTDWKGDQYQTVDINGITDNTCLEIQSTSSKATYTFVDCAPVQQCGDDLYWEYADGVLTITGTGDMYDYAADTDVPWYDVRGNIKTVSLPDAMTKIGQNAFYKCTAMTTINMPTSLTAIGEKAFAQDTRLACEIILPASMTTIASRAFFNCQAVTAFHIEATTPPTIPNDAFERTTAPIHVPCGYGHIYGKHTQWGMLNLEMCELLQDNVYYYPIDGHTARAVTYHSNPTDTLVIPSAVVIDGMPRTVTEVAASAFADCKDIPAIIFNEGLEYIGERAFVRCYGLQGTIVLPATLETIGERAFSYCDNVEKYLIQAMTPPALGDGAFTCANHDALFYVSCEVMDDYKVAARWSSLKSRLRDACLNIYHYNTPLGTNGVYTTEDTLVASIYYRRQFTPYRWETLYLPFEVDRVTVLEDGEEFDLRPWNIITGGDYYLAKPDGMLNLEILFDFTDELEAHTPYIIQFVYDYYRDKIITFYGKESWHKLSTSFEVLSSSSWMQIAGNTTMQDQLLEKPVYMLRSGLDFILQKTTTTLHPFECYVMPYATPSGTPARMNVRFRDDVPTAVESVKGNESHLTYTVDGYTLTVYPQGQAFSIYSLNGALIYSCEAGKEAVDCELNSGCYLLHAGTEAHKIML